MKRQQERAERQGRRGVAERPKPTAQAAARKSSGDRNKRVGVRKFIKQVREELRKVDWPTRRELVSYTIVVLVTVIVLTSLVFGLDLLFSKTIFKLLSS
jgi:preprotein translocase subunit SecE